MNPASRALIVIVLAWPAVGCRGFEPAEYLAVCGGGGYGVKHAPAHDPAGASGDAAPYLVFAALKQPNQVRWLWRQELVPARLASAGAAAPTRARYERTALVLCVEQTSEVPTRECGYDDVFVRLYSGRFRAALREARTGRVVAERSFEVHNEVCPGTAMVSFSDPSPKRYPDPEMYRGEIEALLGPQLPERVQSKLKL